MSVCHNTAVEKLLHKTRKYLQLTAKRNKVGSIRKKVDGKDFTITIQMKSNGEIQIDGKYEADKPYYIHANHNGNNQLVFYGTTTMVYGRDNRQTKCSMDDRTLHYVLRTMLKKGLGDEWVSHRAPVHRKDYRVRLTEGVLLAYK